MKKGIRTTLLLVTASQLFMAVLCEREEIGQVTTRNPFTVTVSNEANFSINDTLWITGRVSSQLFNETTGDSVMNTNQFTRDIISVMRLKTAAENTNTVEALEEFELVAEVGTTDFLGRCPESELIAQAPLAENGQQYAYRIGLVALNSGDFVLSWVEPVTLVNERLNTQILENYPINSRSNKLGLLKCGVGNFIEDVNTDRRSFFFEVN